jgi:hypothetical protein
MGKLEAERLAGLALEMETKGFSVALAGKVELIDCRVEAGVDDVT